MTIADGFSLQAGVGQVDLNPPMGTQLAGDIGTYRPAEIVIDPIYARAVVLELNGRKVCLVSLDLCVLTRESTDQVRRLAAERFGFDKDAVLIHATQNHAAPAFGGNNVTRSRKSSKYISKEWAWLCGGSETYDALVIQRILECIERADQALQPVKLGRGSGIEGRVAFNRRFVMRDGTVQMHPPAGSPDILHAEGPIDPEVGVMALTTSRLETLGLLLFYTCHPVHGWPMRYITSSWPGAWCREMEQSLGGSCIPMVLNGCCGNIHHTNSLDAGHDGLNYQRLGRLLAETTDKVLRNLKYTDEAALDWKATKIKIPRRQLAPADLQKARSLLAAHPEPMWLNPDHTAIDREWVYAVSMVDLQEELMERSEYECEIQVFRIGDCAIVGWPGEPFVEGQLALKLKSPVRHTYVVHMCEDSAGYIPTRKALENGGFETRTARWSQLCPEALDLMVEATVPLLKDLFK